ncbi:hypothetical protein [Burkholderia ubonensis]|uniref:hypothetical protein n=1 Tax=Burkholderia ubonensis TaxID=101571 RepID=UPI000B209B19|nr:hypothetical protein [Burkholderia ubonensis]
MLDARLGAGERFGVWLTERCELMTAGYCDPNAAATIEGTLTNVQFNRAERLTRR